MTTANHFDSIRALREQGYAVAVWTPDEIGNANVRDIEARVTELGNDVIKDLQMPEVADKVDDPMQALVQGDDGVFQGIVYAITSPGGERHPLLKITMHDMELPGESIVIGDFPNKEIQYFKVVVLSADKSTATEIALPPFQIDTAHLPYQLEGLSRDAAAILRCNVDAKFRPQAWVNDYAMDIDDGKVEFSAAPELIQMKLSDVIEMFAENVDFDCLSVGLEARENHDGPFEVDIGEAEMVKMVCLIAGYGPAPFAGRPNDDGLAIRDVTPTIWSAFCNNAKAILQVHEAYKHIEAKVESSAPAP